MGIGMGGVMLRFMLTSTILALYVADVPCQWRSFKEYLPKTLATKSKAGHDDVNQGLLQYTYSWKYRYNKGKELWTAVSDVLKHIPER